MGGLREDLDEGFVGLHDDFGEGGLPSGFRSLGAAGRKRCPRLRFEDADAETEGDETSVVECGICGKVVLPADISFKGNSSVPNHRDCLNAEAYLEMHMRAQVGAANLRKYKTERPREFRYKVLDLLSAYEGGGAKKRRGADDRAKALELMETVSSYSRSYSSQAVLMLGERAFKQWCPIASEFNLSR